MPCSTILVPSALVVAGEGITWLVLPAPTLQPLLLQRLKKGTATETPATTGLLVLQVQWTEKDLFLPCTDWGTQITA